MFESIGLKEDAKLKNNFYGKIEGFYFTATPYNTEEDKCIRFYSSIVNEGLNGKMLDFLEEKKRSQFNFISSYIVEDDCVQIDFIVHEDDSAICEVMKELCRMLKDNEARNACVHCGSAAKLGFYRYNNGICGLCENCGNELIYQIGKINNAKKHYFSGFIGSLLGALVGSAIWIVLGAIGFIASFGGYAIAACSFYGYKFFKGKLTKTGVVLNIISIVVAFIFANFLGTYIANREKFSCSILDFIYIYPLLFTVPEISRELLINIGLGVLFLVWGCWATIKTSFKEAAAKNNAVIEKIDFDDYSFFSDSEVKAISENKSNENS